MPLTACIGGRIPRTNPIFPAQFIPDTGTLDQFIPSKLLLPHCAPKDRLFRRDIPAMDDFIDLSSPTAEAPVQRKRKRGTCLNKVVNSNAIVDLASDTQGESVAGGLAHGLGCIMQLPPLQIIGSHKHAASEVIVVDYSQEGDPSVSDLRPLCFKSSPGNNLFW